MEELDSGMLFHSSISPLTDAQAHFEYAISYLDAAITLCENLINNQQKSYQDGAVVMFLFSHAYELFLKGALLVKKTPQGKIHNLRKMQKIFTKLYRKENISNWKPFNHEFLPGEGKPPFTEQEENKILKEMQIPLPSIFFRYPNHKKSPLSAIEPQRLLTDLKTAQYQFNSFRKFFFKNK